MESEQHMDQSDHSNQIALSIGIYVRYTSTSNIITQQSNRKMESGVNDYRRTTVLL